MNDLLGSSTTAYPDIAPKKWGFEKLLVNNRDYCGKLLYMVAGKSCSVHFHRDKTETFYLHSGRMEISYHDNAEQLLEIHENDKTGDKILDCMEKVVLEQGQTFSVPRGRVHKMTALEDCQLFEFSTHDSPEDSYRIIPSG